MCIRDRCDPILKQPFDFSLKLFYCVGTGSRTKRVLGGDHTKSISISTSGRSVGSVKMLIFAFLASAASSSSFFSGDESIACHASVNNGQGWAPDFRSLSRMATRASGFAGFDPPEINLQKISSKKRYPAALGTFKSIPGQE